MLSKNIKVLITRHRYSHLAVQLVLDYSFDYFAISRFGVQSVRFVSIYSYFGLSLFLFSVFCVFTPYSYHFKATKLTFMDSLVIRHGDMIFVYLQNICYFSLCYADWYFIHVCVLIHQFIEERAYVYIEKQICWS